MAINFGSDNWAGAHPDIVANLAHHAAGHAKPYGESDLDSTVIMRLRQSFEQHDMSVFYVATGTAANALALNAIAQPGGVVFAHRESHVMLDECGAPEYISGGQLRLAQVDGFDGKIDPVNLRAEVIRFAASGLHGGRPIAITISNPTESGTVYELEEIDAIAAVAKEFKLVLHMDGARFGNAVAALKFRPADLTWKRGVDILSFGATKNGCWCAEAVLFFRSDLCSDFAYLRKRSGQLLSKSRFVSAQLEAYLDNDLWLDIATHSNEMCAQLAAALPPTMRPTRLPQVNELFVIMTRALASKLKNEGVVIWPWPTPPTITILDDETVYRFVTSFATTKDEIFALVELANGL